MPWQVDRLPVFYKQRQQGLYPAWAYTLPTTFLRLFYSATEAGLWSLIVYWSVGFAPDAGRRACPRHIMHSANRTPVLHPCGSSLYGMLHKHARMHAYMLSASSSMRMFPASQGTPVLLQHIFCGCTSHVRYRAHDDSGLQACMHACTRRFLTFAAILFLVHCNAVAMFRVFAALTRDMVVATSFGSAFLVIYLMLSGYILAKSALARSCLFRTAPFRW